MDTIMGSRELDSERALSSLYCYVETLDDFPLTFLQPYYVKSTHSLLMTSSTSRSQAANVDDVLSKACVSLDPPPVLFV